DHQAVPAREDLLIAQGLDPALAHFQQLAARLGDESFPLPLMTHCSLRSNGCPGGMGGGEYDPAVGVDQVGNVLALEVAVVRDVIDAAEDLAQIGPQDSLDLRLIPDKILALVPFAVGVLRRIEPAVRMDHLAADVRERLLDDLLEAWLTAQPPAIQVEPDELCVVIEHLLEMRHQPLAVRRVAVKAAADVVVDAAGPHPPE